MKHPIRYYTVTAGMALVLSNSVPVLAQSNVPPEVAPAAEITTPIPISPPITSSEGGSSEGGSSQSGNAISATTGLPAGATATFVDTQSSAAVQNATPPAGTKVAGTAVAITGSQTGKAPVALKLPGASAGMKVARFNEEAGTWEVVGVVEANGKFTPSGDGIYVVLE